MQSEKKFITDGIKQNCRCDGRGILSSRRIKIEKGVCTLSPGSAQLNIELSSPHIICGCKLEIGVPEVEDEGIVNLSIELAGKSLMTDKERMAEVKSLIEMLMLNYFNKKQLCIIPGRKCWKLFIDVEILDKDASNLIEHISLTITSALEDVKVLATEGIVNKNTKEEYIEILDGTVRINIDELPIITTVAQINTSSVLDLTAEEEGCADSLLHFSIDKNGTIKGIIKENPGRLAVDQVLSAANIAKEVAAHIFSDLGTGSIKYKLS
ncbi:unnamed protein product [Blepharisma stoltei]|uniref:Ribosomal RNA-processing protein 42 n=1 Tax=Blepharisma stoltei TaxID=1481888 RepID=A0AAU9JGK5_9CILI|nr:unnamed protein product [Blepharisma stoltei]